MAGEFLKQKGWGIQLTVAELMKLLQLCDPNDVIVVPHYEHGGAMYEAHKPAVIFDNYVAIWPDDERPI